MIHEKLESKKKEKKILICVQILIYVMRRYYLKRTILVISKKLSRIKCLFFNLIQNGLKCKKSFRFQAVQVMIILMTWHHVKI